MGEYSKHLSAASEKGDGVEAPGTTKPRVMTGDEVVARYSVNYPMMRLDHDPRGPLVHYSDYEAERAARMKAEDLLRSVAAAIRKAETDGK